MTGTAQNLVVAFQKVRRVNEACWNTVADEAAALSVDDLKDVVSDIYNVEIDMLAVNFEAEHVKSMVERWDNGRRAVIAVQFGLPEPWKRFAAVKELCHIIIDEPEDFTAPDCRLIENLIEGGALDLEAPENKGVWSERAAEVMAREIVYPHEFRRSDLNLLEHGKVTLAALALRHKVPDLVPSRVLRPSYLDICDRLWAAALAG